ncbi:uncharacterized protein LOC122665569 [Telopea speciosissima]|uniref:uncharacterized protein LOC122665569 n=1 Tax=Telopea speciosissima TaxID=54955 RepID=UPI001CC39E98|nr:uncharacterized protein LOC122665569 [Telopea speciosissima]
MVNTHNQNHSPPRDDAGDISEEGLPVLPPVNTNADVAVEKVKARRFERGLRANLSTSVVPHKYPTYAKVVQAAKMIEDQQKENYNAIQAGMISVCSLPAYVLFDSGASHSFVSPSFVEKLPIKLASMEEKLIVCTPTRSKVGLDQAFNSCPVRVSDHGLEASVIILDKKDFDIILGMDLLSTHRANLIYVERKILFKSEEGKEFVFKGNKSKKPRKTIILALQVQKLLVEGCQCYLASVLDTEAKITPMEEITVARDFPDVFPEDLT